ncbi:MAG: hypothetical protein SCALA702_17990 [Melioribacteraceae bacterium]|nr:MAG: hypothetical protein SCALA702_17990 [Melioribacteraceae bacterium]
MNKLRLIAILFLVFSAHTFSQEWVLKTSGTGQQFYGVTITENDVAYAYGNAGTVVKSTDLGNTWVMLNTNISGNLWSGYAFDENTFIAAGLSGEYIKTTDGGVTFTQLTSTGIGTNLLYEMLFLNDNLGFASSNGGKVYKTTDLGETWNEQTTGGASSLYTVAIQSGDTLFTAGLGGTTKKSTDLGENWEVVSVGITNSCDRIIFKNATIGLASAYSGEIFRTTNGGLSWYPVGEGLTTSLMRDVIFYDDTKAITVGEGGAMLLSVDDGETWVVEDNLPTNNGMFGIGQFSDGSLVVVGRGGTIIKQEVASTVTVTYDLIQGWNTVSVPVLLDDMSTASVFPNAVSEVFKFDNGYTATTQLVNGEGYWVKLGASEMLSLEGLVPAGNIPLLAGWNIIGPFNEEISVSSIVTQPSGIITSQIFVFEGGYTAVDMMEQGFGYWVKTSQAGEIIVNAVAKNNSNSIDLEHGTTIKITDADGYTATLYLAENISDKNLYELPPLPPTSVFDVRFNDGFYVASSGTQILEINSASYPIEIAVSGESVKIEDNFGGNIFSGTISDGHPVVISDNRLNRLNVSSNSLPVEFELDQNYPNPFNPTTNIKFAIPVATSVKLVVYNMLGQQVQTLVNEKLTAGLHEVNLDASRLSSGVYIYAIEARGDDGQNFSQTRKMMLIK